MLRSTEFAYQLCYLYENDPIKGEHRDYISKWLVTVLMNEGSTTATEQEFPVVRKKIRDEVLGKRNDYFRRSSFYMAVKVFLLQKLTHDMGHDTANFLYKIIMLQFLTHQCDVFNESYCKQLNIELVTQTMAKLARRCEKMSDMKAQQFEDKYKDLAERVIRNAYRTIKETRMKVNAQIEHLQVNDALRSTLKPLVDLNFEVDIHQKVPKLRQHIKKRSEENVEFVEPTLQVKKYQRHYMAQPNAPPITSNSSEIDQHFIITDFENWILYDLHIDETHFASNDLRSWCETYIHLAQSFYKSDQLGVSKSVLVSLKMIAMLDKIATTAYPMLLQHNSGINTKIIDHILLPQLADMKIAHELEKYFNARNLNGNLPSLIGESGVSKNSFSVRYAATNKDMQTLLNEIETMGKRKIEEKREEWTRRRAEVQDLRDRAARLSCEYYVSSIYGWTHRSSCIRCSLDTQAKGIKICIYERPLPDDCNEKNAVIFELRIPFEVACLRDTLQTFTKYCNGQELKSMTIRGNWINYSQIAQYGQTKSRHVHLGSSRNSVDQSGQLHVDKDFSEFNCANGYDCTYHSGKYEMALRMQDTSIKKRCIFQVQNEYLCLQWTLESTSHTQNAVLTSQSDCPQDLSLLEFKNFGSIRADGHRLQWRNLYRMIACEGLSLQNPSVLSLFMQVTKMLSKIMKMKNTSC